LSMHSVLYGTLVYWASKGVLRYKSLKSLARIIPFLGGAREIWSCTALLSSRGFFVADVGAYRGWYTVLAGLLVGSTGHIYSFEPELNNFEYLRMAVRMSKLDNVTLFRLALGDKDGIATLYLSEHPSMHSMVLKRGYKQVNVPMLKLDSLVKRGLIKHLDLIKLDVEGAELAVLRGAVTTISMFKPVFSIDVNHYPGEYDDVILALRSFDYICSPLHKYDDKPYSLVCYHPIKAYLARKLINFNIDLLRC
jgi:FkbM family methyltransferase